MRRKNEPIDVFKHILIPEDGNPVPCWPWQGKLNPTDGRPYFVVGGVRWLAYRLVFTLVHGPIAPGVQIRHKECDNEGCCNPYHLLDGSRSDNEHDKYDHERMGFPHHVIELILTLQALPQQKIAEVVTADTGIVVTQQRVSDILNGVRRQRQRDIIQEQLNGAEALSGGMARQGNSERKGETR